MKRLLAFMGLLCLLLHWHQAVERCRRADERARAAREELQKFEEALKEWPLLRRQASRLRPLPDPRQIPHEEALQTTFRADKVEDQQVFQMHIRGSRDQVGRQLQALTRHFCITALDLRSPSPGVIQGEATLLAVP